MMLENSPNGEKFVLILRRLRCIFLPFLVDEPIETARALLRRMQQTPFAERSTLADELLLFLYRLKDEYAIVESTSRSISGKSFAVLQTVIYDLESAPDATMHSEETVGFLRTLLEEIVRGSIVIQKK